MTPLFDFLSQQTIRDLSLVLYPIGATFSDLRETDLELFWPKPQLISTVFRQGKFKMYL